MVNSNEGLEALAALASAVPVSYESKEETKSSKGKKKCCGAGNEKAPPAPSSAPDPSAPPPPAPQVAGTQPQSAFQPAAAAIPLQWQQALAAAANSNAGNSSMQAAAPLSPPPANNNSSHPQLNLLANLQRQLQGTDPNALMALQQQQMNYFQLLQLAQQQQPPPQQQQPPPQQQQPSAPAPAPSNTSFNPQLQALQLALQGRSIPGLSGLIGAVDNGNNRTSGGAVPPPAPQQQQVLPTGAAAAAAAGGRAADCMQPPPPSVLAQQQQQQHRAIAPQLSHLEERAAAADLEHQLEDRKLQKRAANRRSAQLSRKRKKQFIEELKDENDGLRRKEQILRSIPDLIVVFDSSGRLWFVSESVSRFLDFTAGELEGTSFWDRLCEDSVRLLKAAFMDSLAARRPDSDMAALGSGFWELRLVDKDASQKVVTLNGVVHFAGERPECVCSIRPHEEMFVRRHHHQPPKKAARKAATQPPQATATQPGYKSLARVKPHQSVVSASSFTTAGKLRASSSIRVSDSGNSSGISDSGSSDELNANDTTAS